jgi:arabinofuranosyltransferase
MAKDAGGTYWSQGWNYLIDLVSPYWLLVPIAAMVLAGLYLASRRAGPPLAAVLALPVGGFLHGLLVVRSGGDYMHGRLLLPSMFAILAPIAVVPWSRRLTIPITIMTLWALLAAVTLHVHSVSVSPLYPALRQTEHGTTDTRALMEQLAKPGHRPLLASDFKATDGIVARRLQDAGARALVLNYKVFRRVTPQRTVLASTSSGVSGYLAGPDVIVHEFYGLGDPVGSRMTPNPTSVAGHRKLETDPWILALETKPGFSGEAAPEKVQSARRALRCGSLAELLAASDGRLTVGRFWSNLTGVLGRTRLVVPREPRDARRKFCG